MVEETQEALRGWIDRILQARHWSKTRLAKEAGVAQTTITRLYDDRYDGAMNSTTVTKIARASGIAPPRSLGLSDDMPGFREPELIPLAIDAAEIGDGHVTEWRIAGNALVLAGYLPGDKVWVRDDIRPEHGDIVIAQVYNIETGTAETVIRIYNPPYLTTASIAVEDRKPLIVDGERVLIRGVVIRSERRRRAP